MIRKKYQSTFVKLAYYLVKEATHKSNVSHSGLPCHTSKAARGRRKSVVMYDSGGTGDGLHLRQMQSAEVRETVINRADSSLEMNI